MRITPRAETSPPRPDRSPKGVGHVLMLVASLAILGFCPGAGCLPPPDPEADGTAGIDPADFPGQHVAGEPNDTFDDPLLVIFDETGRARLEGTVADVADVDLYDLGTLVPGDRIILDAGTPGSSLDAAVVLFDEAGRLIFENDDRNLPLGQFDPFLNAVLARETSTVFLAIAASPLAPSAGAYHVLVSVTREGAPPTGEEQTVALDFDGGTVVIPGDEIYTVDVFDAADVASAYEGLTGIVREQIVATVRENYEGLALDVRVMPGDVLPSGCSFSTVLFGGRNRAAFGVSQDVDGRNENKCDDSIIFTETFRPSMFGRTLSATELGSAIGNVASHEIGHLLGLNHVGNVTDLMDNTGGPNTFVADQEFTASALDESVFPLGLQDGWLLLLETLGALP